jgi:hypothetical protein
LRSCRPKVSAVTVSSVDVIGAAFALGSGKGAFPSVWLWPAAWQDGGSVSVIPLAFVSDQRLRGSFCKIVRYMPR